MPTYHFGPIWVSAPDDGAGIILFRFPSLHFWGTEITAMDSNRQRTIDDHVRLQHSNGAFRRQFEFKKIIRR